MSAVNLRTAPTAVDDAGLQASRLSHCVFRQRMELRASVKTKNFFFFFAQVLKLKTFSFFFAPVFSD